MNSHRMDSCALSLLNIVSVRFISLVYSSSLLFCCRLVFHCVNIPQFIHSVVDGNLALKSLPVMKKQAAPRLPHHRKGSK